MELIPEIEHGKTEESGTNSYINDLKVEQVWTNNIREKEEQRRSNRSLQIHWKGSTTEAEVL